MLRCPMFNKTKLDVLKIESLCSKSLSMYPERNWPHEEALFHTHQQAIGNASGVSAAGIQAIKLMWIHVRHQPLTEKIACAV